MGFKSLVLASAATAALGVGFATPALAHENVIGSTVSSDGSDGGRDGGRGNDGNQGICGFTHWNRFDDHNDNGRNDRRFFENEGNDNFRNRDGRHRFRRESHPFESRSNDERDERPFGFRRNEEFIHFRECEGRRDEGRDRTRIIRETRSVPTGFARTGFGGGSDAVSIPLVAGGLSIITGGLGLGGLATRRRLSGVRS